MARKLLAQRRRTGDTAPRRHRCKGKAKLLKTHQRQWRALGREQPDLTLGQRRAATALPCSLVAIRRALVKLGLAHKKDAARQRAGPPRHGASAPGVAAAATGEAV